MGRVAGFVETEGVFAGVVLEMMMLVEGSLEDGGNGRGFTGVKLIHRGVAMLAIVMAVPGCICEYCVPMS